MHRIHRDRTRGGDLANASLSLRILDGPSPRRSRILLLGYCIGSIPSSPRCRRYLNSPLGRTFLNEAQVFGAVLGKGRSIMSMKRPDPPSLVVSADWGTRDRNRWSSNARRQGAVYVVEAPHRIGNAEAWFGGLLDSAESSSVLVGVDSPIGVPMAWAAAMGRSTFRDVLSAAGTGDMLEFFIPSDEPRLGKPFYPRTAAGSEKVKLARALGVPGLEALLRTCDQATNDRARAECLFWLVGPKQVGKAAISLWQTLLQPNLHRLRLWPFEGDLWQVAQPGKLGLCEIYPAESLTHVVPREFRGSKKLRDARSRMCGALQLGDLPIAFSHSCALALANGFESEDAFDSFIGLLSMLLVVLGEREADPPTRANADANREIEGWILGLNGR